MEFTVIIAEQTMQRFQFAQPIFVALRDFLRVETSGWAHATDLHRHHCNAAHTVTTSNDAF